jgi:hypothetical protein
MRPRVWGRIAGRLSVRMRGAWRGLVALAIGLCYLPWPGGQPARAASGIRTVVSARYRYSVAYPASWRPLHVAGATFAALAPDRNALVSITTEPGRATAAALRKALLQVFAPFGRPLQAPVLDTMQLHGATGVLARDLVASPRGAQTGVVAVAVSRRGRLYTLLGVVPDTRAPSATADTDAVLAIIGSVGFF